MKDNDKQESAIFGLVVTALMLGILVGFFLHGGL